MWVCGFVLPFLDFLCNQRVDLLNRERGKTTYFAKLVKAKQIWFLLRKLQFLIIVVFVGIFVLAPIEARTHTTPLMIIVLVGNGNILS
ncbi:hypothetical protein HQ38_02265 [Porphyromonas crevioricanis]|uniref:Uncharacterized protein n=1 Tax=Porphyromonas crevioricanis TaxID=393921 RepID=A0AB34PGI0_9PORP|nr:hypothetical protein HQ38_02265 [Porphyromonas crevioricanis]